MLAPGFQFHALKSIFITHHHADHNIEYRPRLIVGWIQGLPLASPLRLAVPCRMHRRLM
jgi:ribonuclease BN (tRNA processing enzyme)